MMYFMCSSPWTVCLTMFMLETEYKNSKEDKVILMLEHVHNVISLENALLENNVFSNSIIIKTVGVTDDQISAQINQLNMKNVIYHFFAFEKISFMLYSALKEDSSAIFISEGGYTDLNVEENLRIRHMELCYGKDFNFSSLKKIYYLDMNLACKNSLGIPEYQVNFNKYINDISWRNKFLYKVAKLYNIESNLNIDNRNIIFDRYLSKFGCTSLKMELFLLDEILQFSSIENLDLCLKRHPGEDDINKFKNLDVNFFENNIVPWEAICLQNKDNIKNGVILIGYGSQAILNARFILGEDNCHCIYLNNILKKYSQSGDIIITENYIKKFIEKHGNKNIYLPDSFTELRRIICKIRGIQFTDEQYDLFRSREYDNSLKFLRKYCDELWRDVPNFRNITTLQADTGDGFKDVKSIEIITDNINEDFIFKFDINNINNILRFQWYAVRGRNTRIKIISINYVLNTEEVIEVDSSLISSYGIIEDDYIKFLGFDPTIFWNNSVINIKYVVIKGTWIFDNSYTGAVCIANEMSYNLANRLTESIKNVEEKQIEINKISIHHNSTIALLNEKINKQKEEIICKNSDIERVDTKLIDLNHKLIIMEDEITEFKLEKQNLMCEINNFRMMLDDREIALNNITQSTSWKITKPLRSLFNIMRRQQKNG